VDQGGCVSTPTYPDITCIFAYDFVVCDAERNCRDGVTRTVNNVPVPCPYGPYNMCTERDNS
jgi:hypothetical protein